MTKGIKLISGENSKQGYCETKLIQGKAKVAKCDVEVLICLGNL